MVTRLLGLLALMQAALVCAQELRVVSWDLERARSAAPGAGAAQLRKAAGYLQQLDGDVILLQSVQSWAACRELVELLEPAKYQVLVCSAFGGANPEVAVLAKRPARVGWSEPWSEQGGGFAFAIVPFGDKRVGFFSVRFPGGDRRSSDASRARETACRQLLDQIEAAAQWEQNKIDVWVVGGNFSTSPELEEQEWTLPMLEEAGFANAYFTVARENRLSVRGLHGAPDATLDYLFVKNGAFVSAPSLLLAEGFPHRPLACEIDPAQISAPTSWFEQVRRAQGERRLIESEARAAAADAARVTPSPLWPWWAAGGLLLVLAGGFSFWWWRLSVRLRGSQVWALTHNQEGYEVASLPPTDPGQALIADEFADTDDPDAARWRERAEAAEKRAAQATHLVKAGLLPPLIEWFKHAVVRKLTRQRSDLIDSHQRATDQVRALEEQVARIHGGMQDRISGYERRIRELERELAYAKAEQRDLIAAQIRTTREQLERARHAVPESR